MNRRLSTELAFSTPEFGAFKSRITGLHPEFKHEPPSPQDVDRLLHSLIQRGFGKKEPKTAGHWGTAQDIEPLYGCTGMYKMMRIPKRRGGHREIRVPPEPLMTFQRLLLNWLMLHGPQPPLAARGFVRGYSHVDHARLHANQGVVASIDLKDFFGSVTELHLWHVLHSTLPQLSTSELRTLIWLVTIDVNDVHAPGRTRRPWIAEACTLVVQYLRYRMPISHALARAITENRVDSYALSASRVAKVAQEWSTTSDKLYIGLARSLEVNPSWSPSGRRLATMLCLATGLVRTESRRRLIVDLLTAVGLGSWVEDTRGTKSINALRTVLSLDLQKRKADGRMKWLPDAPLSEARISSPDPPGSQTDPIPFEHGIRVLPQGAPTSPWLANLAAEDLDAEVATYAEQHGLTYSRYADDLAFSGATLPQRFVHRIAELVACSGFRINRDKVVIRYRHQRQVVTGIVVNERLSPQGMGRRQLRAMLHTIKLGNFPYLTDGLPLTDAQLRGHRAYWHMVDPSRAADLSLLPASSDEEGEE